MSKMHTFCYRLNLLTKKVRKTPKDGVQSKLKAKSRNYTISNLAVCKEVFKGFHDITNDQLGRILKLCH